MSKRDSVNGSGTVRPAQPLRRGAHLGAAGVWGCVLALTACGGGKPAESPGTCPEGTVLVGDNCMPESPGGSKSSGEGATASEGQQDTGGSAKASKKPSSGAASTASDLSEGGGPPYDKDAVEAQLKRAARQIKANCGSASDEEGNKTGPWGSTSATIVLGRNGHIQDVSVPAPYAGKPVGDCVVNSFKKIWFPPYAGSSDVTVNWDVDIVQPKK